MAELIQIGHDGHITTVLMNRPEKLNALTEDMFMAMTREIHRASGDPTVRAVVIAGSGKAFSAGADIKGYVDHGLDAFVHFQRLGRALNDAIAAAAVPVIAVVEGLALGGGFEIALACDFIVAGPNARFGLPEVKLGLLPGGGGTQRLPRIIGHQQAKSLLFTGDTLDAQSALEQGIVLAVAEDPHEQARRLAGRFLPWPRRAIAAIKQAVNEASPLEIGLALEYQSLLALYQSPEGQEGMRAFVEKRPPRFRDLGGSGEGGREP